MTFFERNLDVVTDEQTPCPAAKGVASKQKNGAPVLGTHEFVRYLCLSHAGIAFLTITPASLSFLQSNSKISMLTFNRAAVLRFKGIWAASTLLLSPTFAAPLDRVMASDASLRLDHGKLILEKNGDVLAEILNLEFNFVAPSNIEVESTSSGHMRLRAIYPQNAEYENGRSDLDVAIDVTALPHGFRIQASPTWARNTTIRLVDLNDHFFGVVERLEPNNLPSPDLRGASVNVDAQGDGSEFHENYASAWSAFYMTNKGYAVFYDTFAKGHYRLGINGETELSHRTGKLDWYIFLGANGDEILKSYYSVIGMPKHPPLWAMGPVGWRDENAGSSQVVDDISRLTELKIPFTAWWIDRPYSDGANEWSKMNFSAKFQNPAEWIKTVAAKFDIKLMTWVAPMTFGDLDFPNLLPGETSYMDLTAPRAIAEFGRRLKSEQYAFGIKGHKMDRAEEFFPEMAHWSDGTPDSETRNRYLFLYAKTIDGFLREAWGEDEFNFARTAVHRSQHYLSAVWGGDSRASWDGLAGNLANSIRCGFMGFPVWGSDTGGYLEGVIDEELYARWLEWGVWNGMDEIKIDNFAGHTPARPPWAYSAQLQAIFRQSCSLRMQLLPYLYSLANTSDHTGVLMKPLAYVWPTDPNTFRIWNEYLLGPSFLIAPITAPGGTRSVYLPQGDWYDYHDCSKRWKGPCTIEVSTPLDKIPVFVRGNSIYVTGTSTLGNQRVWNQNAASTVSIHVTPGIVGESTEFELVSADASHRVDRISAKLGVSQLTVSMPSLPIPAEIVYPCEHAIPVRINGASRLAVFDPNAKEMRVQIPEGQSTVVEFSLRAD